MKTCPAGVEPPGPLPPSPYPLSAKAWHRLQPGERIDSGAFRVSDLLLREATRHLGNPRRVVEEDIHAVRTAIKKVRALLRLIRPWIGDTAFRRENDRLRKTARLLSPMRDATVGLHTLEQLSQSTRHPRKQRHCSTVHSSFAREHAHTVADGKTKALHATLGALMVSRRRLKRLHLRVRDRPPLHLGVDNVYRACQRRMRQAFASGDDASFHRWRIRLKNLYYELQFLTPVWPGRLGSMVAQLKEVQEAIGNDHDLSVLKSALQAAPERFGGEETVDEVLLQLKKHSRMLRRQCRPAAEEVFLENPAHFARHLEEHLKSRRITEPPTRRRHSLPKR